MDHNKPFSKDLILLRNIESVTDNIIKKMQQDVLFNLKRQGAVIGISGGIDSSVCLGLAAKAFGPEKVLGIIMPEKDSSPESEELALELAGKFNVSTVKEDITEALAGFRCYERRDEAVKRVFPEYDPGTYKMKIGIRQSGLFSNLPPIFTLTIVDKDGKQQDKILHTREYLQIVAASNFKQRSRMNMLYYHAEALHYAVIGTPNKHEQEQGFFVKYGDGGADVKPIAHLFKTQVYQLAEFLGVPEEIRKRTPTTDTYSAEQTQEEFFYKMPFEVMDRIWDGWEKGVSSDVIAKVINVPQSQVDGTINDIRQKIQTTEYLRQEPFSLG